MTELKTTLRYYGISPWEIEVLYGFLNSHFTIIQDEIEANDQNFVSFIDMQIPLAFDDVFFQWFDFKRWDKVKAVFKEMKRRRGSGNALKVQISFDGTPKIIFIADVDDKQRFDNSIEKIDFVLELLPHHLDPAKMPPGINSVTYKFDSVSARWKLDTALSSDKKYKFVTDTWMPIT